MIVGGGRGGGDGAFALLGLGYRGVGGGGWVREWCWVEGIWERVELGMAAW